MPGKHAPASPRSYYLSVARVAGALVAAIVLLVVIVSAATTKHPVAKPSTSGSPSAAPSASASPSPDVLPTDEPSTVASASPKPRAQVAVAVLNGTNRPGLAKKVADLLKKDGWTKIVEIANAPGTSATNIGYLAGSRIDAEALNNVHPELGKILRVTDSPKNAVIVITLGKDYPG